MKHHLRFKNLHPSIVGAAERLFEARPWAADETDRDAAANAFLADLGETYRVAPPIFTGIDYWSMPYGYTPEVTGPDSFGGRTVIQPARIRLPKWSIVMLFQAARHHLVETGAAEPVSEEDEFAWACSLFYRVRPVMFRARAREGRMGSVSARDTYTASSWEKLVNAGVTYGDDLDCDPQIASDILNERYVPSDDEPALIDEQEETGDPEGRYFAGESDGGSNEAHEIAEAAEATLPEGVVVGEDERAEISEVLDGLDNLNRDQVRALAVANGIPRGDRNKDQLVEALRAAGVRA